MFYDYVAFVRKWVCARRYRSQKLTIGLSGKHQRQHRHTQKTHIFFSRQSSGEFLANGFSPPSPPDSINRIGECGKCECRRKKKQENWFDVNTVTILVVFCSCKKRRNVGLVCVPSNWIVPNCFSAFCIEPRIGVTKSSGNAMATASMLFQCLP